MKVLSVAILFCLMPAFSSSQEKDSLALYRKIKKAANRYKITTWAYKLVFVDPEPMEYPVIPTAKEEKNVNPYLKFRGQIIRNIRVKVLDPFGYSINDTLPQKINSVRSMGNRLHIRTRQFIIFNRLLFKRNDSLNAIALSETERTLRQAVFVNDARIEVNGTPGKDSVDVVVIVHDKWPLTAPAIVTDIFASVTFRNSNFCGLGQQFEQRAYFHRPDIYDFSGSYNVANIGNSFASSRVAYFLKRESSGVSFSVDRPFYSPLARWAGGLSLGHVWNTWSYFSATDSLVRIAPLNQLYYDVWGGRSIKTGAKKMLFNLSSNIILGARYYGHSFVNRPSSPGPHRNYQAFVGNAGFAIQQYYKEKFVYRFGANEDVPEGLIVQLIYGADKRERSSMRYYNGIEIARARHYGIGYFSATFSYGVFYSPIIANDVTMNYKLYYFSDLFRLKKWYFRQFFNFNYVHGENKKYGESITIDPSELYGFRNDTLSGNSKFLINSETVAYLPYKFIGFRFAPVIMAGIGWLTRPDKGLFESRLYQGYSLGLMLRNENLLTSTILVSFGFYPHLPEGRNNVLVYNPVTSFTLRVRAFSVNKPSFVAY